MASEINELAVVYQGTKKGSLLLLINPTVGMLVNGIPGVTTHIWPFTTRILLLIKEQKRTEAQVYTASIISSLWNWEPCLA